MTLQEPAAGAAPHRLCVAARRLDDRGESPELVLVLPVLMGLLLFALQLVLWALAAHALALAVAEGGATARTALGNPTVAASLVRRDVHAVAGSLVGSLDVAVERSPDAVVTVTASGVVLGLLPGIHLHVSAESVGPEQAFHAGG